MFDLPLKYYDHFSNRYLMHTNHDTGDTHVIKEYNMVTRRWISSSDLQQSKDTLHDNQQAQHERTQSNDSINRKALQGNTST
jgi:hypothetical protein